MQDQPQNLPVDKDFIDAFNAILSVGKYLNWGGNPMTPRSKNALAIACKIAAHEGIPYIGSEHLLIGLLRSGGIAGSVLSGCGITEEIVRAKIDSKLDEPV
jgi:hypothetical protein